LALAAPLRAEVRAVDPTLPEVRTADLERAVRDYVSPQRFTTSVLGVFALLGLSLAALGVYGVMRCWVAARVPEIGIRMALGAQPRDTLRLVLGRSARAVLAGVALGSGGALALRRVLASQLHGVSPTDPAVFAAVVALLSAVALAAAWAPARWATKVDPVQALRYE
jgi:putative ABC transport system permease protein